MQNDERDERERLEAQERGEPQEPGAPEDTGAAEEFETAAWPQHDIGEPAVAQPDAVDEAAQGGAEAADEQPVAEPAWESPGIPEPPPPDVEAYASPPAEVADDAVPAHSVPATEPGESTRCPRCGTENRPGIAFCRNCGQRLVAAGAPTTVARPVPPEGTQACPRCGTHNRAGVAFCQNCGANLRAAEAGYVPPAVAGTEAAAPAAAAEAGRAILGPVVLLIGAIGIATAWLLPFLVGDDSLYAQAFGRTDGYGIAFWSAYDGISGLAEQAYFGFAAPAPILVVLLLALAIGGLARRAPGPLQLIGLVVALVWAIGLAVLFFVVEVFGGPGGELLDILRALSPGGIIFMLASLIVVIGTLTRIARG